MHPGLEVLLHFGNRTTLLLAHFAHQYLVDTPLVANSLVCLADVIAGVQPLEVHILQGFIGKHYLDG